MKITNKVLWDIQISYCHQNDHVLSLELTLREVVPKIVLGGLPYSALCPCISLSLNMNQITSLSQTEHGTWYRMPCLRPEYKRF